MRPWPIAWSDRIQLELDGHQRKPLSTPPRDKGNNKVPKRARSLAIWDVNQALPELEQTVRTMNEAQSLFDFSAVTLSAPSGTWRRQRVDGEDQTFIEVEAVTRRLEHQPQKLGVDRILCISDFALRNSDTLYLLIAWVGDSDRVAVASTFETLAEVRRRHFSVQRMIAATAASYLACTEGGADYHRVKPTSCPDYYNQSRDVVPLVSGRPFCRKCRTVMDRAVSAALGAAIRAVAARFKNGGQAR